MPISKKTLLLLFKTLPCTQGRTHTLYGHPCMAQTQRATPWRWTCCHFCLWTSFNYRIYSNFGIYNSCNAIPRPVLGVTIDHFCELQSTSLWVLTTLGSYRYSSAKHIFFLIHNFSHVEHWNHSTIPCLRLRSFWCTLTWAKNGIPSGNLHHLYLVNQQTKWSFLPQANCSIARG